MTKPLITLVVIVCPACDEHFAVDKRLTDYKTDMPPTHEDWGICCPNGHPLGLDSDFKPKTEFTVIEGGKAA